MNLRHVILNDGEESLVDLGQIINTALFTLHSPLFLKLQKKRDAFLHPAFLNYVESFFKN
jgi:hypothetical protein